MTLEQEEQQLDLHLCTGLVEHNDIPFNIDIEIHQDGTLMIHDSFTKSTPSEFQRKHETCYSVTIKFCPFCAEVLNKD